MNYEMSINEAHFFFKVNSREILRLYTQYDDILIDKLYLHEYQQWNNLIQIEHKIVNCQV